jgi:hypothetical protein
MNTKSIIALPAAIFAGIALALTISIVTTLTVSADTQKAETKTSETKPKAAAANYSYTAQVGDSYSKIARKAVQTYGIKNKVNLSQGRIIFAETNLTQAAGSPLLSLGEKVTLSEATVKSWVEKAQKLSKEDAAKWDKYTKNVNFDTRAVGEKR